MRLVWCDLETTGLDPRESQILEIAVAEADLSNPFQVRHVYHAILPLQHQESLSPFIKEMHTKNGLLSECAASPTTLSSVDKDLADIFPFLEDKEERHTLAGSSIHFDHSFIKLHLPLFNRGLSHRHYDVSAIKLYCQSMGMSPFKKAEAHRAKDDIEESVAHARECSEWLKSKFRTF